MFIIILDSLKMENNDLTYWKNYQAAMQWVKDNTINYESTSRRSEEENQMIDNEDEQLEFTISDDLLDFYRLSREHKINRSK